MAARLCEQLMRGHASLAGCGEVLPDVAAVHQVERLAVNKRGAVEEPASHLEPEACPTYLRQHRIGLHADDLPPAIAEIDHRPADATTDVERPTRPVVQLRLTARPVESAPRPSERILHIVLRHAAADLVVVATGVEVADRSHTESGRLIDQPTVLAHDPPAATARKAELSGMVVTRGANSSRTRRRRPAHRAGHGFEQRGAHPPMR